jgi:uncharacterized protein
MNIISTSGNLLAVTTLCCICLGSTFAATPDIRARPAIAVQPIAIDQARVAAAQPSAPARRPSFNCNRDLNESEQAICNSQYLAQLDVTKAKAERRKFSQMDAEGLSKFRREYSSWLAWRNICNDDEACLIRRYNNRIAELTGQSAQDTEIVHSPCSQGKAKIVSKRFNPEFERMETVLSDGSVLWSRLTGARNGGICKDGTQIPGVVFIQVPGASLPVLASGLTDWGSNLEVKLLKILTELMPPNDLAMYQTAIDEHDYYDRLNMHLASINFWLTR